MATRARGTKPAKKAQSDASVSVCIFNVKREAPVLTHELRKLERDLSSEAQLGRCRRLKLQLVRHFLFSLSTDTRLHLELIRVYEIATSEHDAVVDDVCVLSLLVSFALAGLEEHMKEGVKLPVLFEHNCLVLADFLLKGIRSDEREYVTFLANGLTDFVSDARKAGLGCGLSGQVNLVPCRASRSLESHLNMDVLDRH